jgi:hypothetical protein
VQAGAGRGGRAGQALSGWVTRCTRSTRGERSRPICPIRQTRFLKSACVGLVRRGVPATVVFGDLFARFVPVSMENMTIVDALPSLSIRAHQHKK